MTDARDSLNFSIMTARSAKEKVWTPQTLTFDQLVDRFSYHRPTSSKDGPCYLPGLTIGTARKADAVSSISCLVYDVDSKQSWDEVIALVASQKRYAIVHTTYSHLQSKTHIRTDQYVTFAKANKLEAFHNEAGVRAYLAAKDLGHLQNVVLNEALEHTPDGMCISVSHDPIHKIRVIFPLAVPFNFANHGYTTGEMTQSWKRYYIGIGKKIGLNFDRACSDQSRLYYFPSHPETSIEGVEGYQSVCADFPDLLNYRDYPQAAIEEIRTRTPHQFLPSGDTLEQKDNYVIKSADGEQIDLAEWWRTNAKGAGEVLIEVLRQRVPDIFRDEAHNKPGLFHIECPHEELHTTAGGTGTFITDGRETGWPRIHCQHQHCKDFLNEDYLSKIISNGWLDATSLGVIARVSRAWKPEIMGGDLASFISGALAPALPMPEEEEAAAGSPQKPTTAPGTAGAAVAFDPLLYAGSRTAILDAVKNLHDNQAKLPGRLLDVADLITTAADYESFWRKSANTFNIHRDAATDLFIMAITKMPFRTIRTYFKEHADRLILRISEVTETIQKIRSHNHPIRIVCEQMHTDRLLNTELLTAIRACADYYGVLPSRVEDLFNEVSRTNTHEAESEIRAAAEIFNATHSKLANSNDTLIIDEPRSRQTGKLCTQPINAVRSLHSNHRFTIDYGDRSTPQSMAVVDYWLKRIPNQRVYTSAVFDPSGAENTSTFNTFAGFQRCKPVPGDWGIISDHLKKVWCKDSPELYNWVITYMANIIQQPAKRPSTAIAVIGSQGSGKSIILEHGLVPIIAPYGRVSNKRDDISSRFNGIFANTLLYVAEEAIFSGDHQTMEKLKAYISADYLDIELKGRESAAEKFYVRFFFTANAEHSLRLSPDDRRFLVLETSNAHTQDIRYFSQMRAWLDNAGRNHLHQALLDWNPESVGMSWGDLTQPPVTDMKLRQIKLSHDTPRRFFLDLLLNGTLTDVREDALEFGNIEWNMDGETFVRQTYFAAAFRDFVQANGNKQYDKTKMHSAFMDVIGHTWHHCLRRGYTKQKGVLQNCVVLPPRRQILDYHRGKMVPERDYETAVNHNETIPPPVKSEKINGVASD